MRPDQARDLARLWSAIRAGAMNGPKDRYRIDKHDGVAISTVETWDYGWETALIDANGTHPVERYESRAKAEAGHARWVERNQRDDFAGVEVLGYGETVPAEPLTVRRGS